MGVCEVPWHDFNGIVISIKLVKIVNTISKGFTLTHCTRQSYSIRNVKYIIIVLNMIVTHAVFPPYTHTHTHTYKYIYYVLNCCSIV